jgi:hypothetical protein
MINTYLQELVSYLTDPRYYYEAARRSFGSRLLFFVVSIGILSISMSVRVHTRFIPQLKDGVSKLSSELVTKYPADYQFAWDGATFTAQPAQLTIPYPADTNPSELSLPSQAGFIDTTRTEFTETELATFSALLAVSQQKLYVHQQTGQWQSLALQDVLGSEPQTLTAETAGVFAQEAAQFLQTLIDRLTPVMYIVMPSLLIFGTLWQHFFDFVLITILFQLGSRKQSPGTTLKMILPLLVVVTALVEVALWLYPSSLATFPLRQVAFWILFTYIFWFGLPETD